MKQDASGWIEFETFSYEGTDSVSAGAGEFVNPILPGFAPDPAICRAGDDYYIVTSSFTYFPGVPIFHSRDLVNWTQIGHVLDRPSQLPIEKLSVSEGIYAPAISYHDGKFWMITTLTHWKTPGGGNFFVTASDPKGPWSERTMLPEVGGIDPSFFFDRDGKAYIVNNDAPSYPPLYDGHRAIWMQEFDARAGKTTGERKVIVDGGTEIKRKPVWIEAPHVFRRGDFYYLICAEDGTAENHSEVVFRSKNVWGPYVPWEKNPILTQRHLDANRKSPITCTGHADFVETPNGEWWAVFLGCRPYEDNLYNLGRETFLLPVRWEDDWPVILSGDAVVPRVLKKPKLPPQAKAGENDFQWVQLRTPRENWFEKSGGRVRIQPRGIDLCDDGNPSFLSRPARHIDFVATTKLHIDPQTADAQAGLVAFQSEKFYFFLGVVIDGSRGTYLFLERRAGGEREDVAGKVILATSIELKIEGAGRDYSFSYRLPDEEWTPLITHVDGSILSTKVAGGFVGTMIGMFARESVTLPRP